MLILRLLQGLPVVERHRVARLVSCPGPGHVPVTLRSHAHKLVICIHTWVKALVSLSIDSALRKTLTVASLHHRGSSPLVCQHATQLANGNPRLIRLLEQLLKL